MAINGDIYTAIDRFQAPDEAENAVKTETSARSRSREDVEAFSATNLPGSAAIV